MALGHRTGAHRVLAPLGELPQAATRLDNDFSRRYDNEILIDVEALHITATAFRQLVSRAQGDPTVVAETILSIVAERGKFQDPDTGSGGILVGRVAWIGPALRKDIKLEAGDPIATLVSLSLTPLYLDRIHKVRMDNGHVYVQGQAVLFESGLWARLPSDIPRSVSLAVLDVAGAPAHTAWAVRPGYTVLVIGGGKAGLLCLHEARKRVGVTGKVLLVEMNPQRCQQVKDLALADVVIQGDATQALAILEQVEAATAGRLADLSINCASTGGTEMATILSTRPNGLIYFFSMSTSFTRAALGAEGVGRPVTMLIGNGYLPGHAELALQIIRENQGLRRWFEELYGDRPAAVYRD
ncbi:MAG: NAD-binding protein [Anaerolineae bacterium]